MEKGVKISDQSEQSTGSGTVPNLVQVYRIRYIQSHNASDGPKLFQISNWQIKEKFQILFKVLCSKDNSVKYKTKRYSTFKVHSRKLTN